MHEANKKWWDVKAADWQKLDDRNWRKCPEQPGLAFEGGMLEMIRDFCGDMAGKKALAVASGDNYVVFALAGMGANVTSTDISQNRLDIASERAGILGLDIEFVRCDAADLSKSVNDNYDLVVSTPGTFVWLSDLKQVFSEIRAILKPGGWYIFREIHPFTRPFRDQREMEIYKSYFDIGPFTTTADGIETTICNLHWKVSDIFNALTDSGFHIRKLNETPAENAGYWEGAYYGQGGDERLLDWRFNPQAAIP
ncbi:MAG: class I SAM-dependent methyltransferase [Dehalococcoidales bacterium]|nr:class I SAM-dependent methyltransferase [Dehalococcoidales bacterium]